MEVGDGVGIGGGEVLFEVGGGSGKGGELTIGKTDREFVVGFIEGELVDCVGGNEGGVVKDEVFWVIFFRFMGRRGGVGIGFDEVLEDFGFDPGWREVVLGGEGLEELEGVGEGLAGV